MLFGEDQAVTEPLLFLSSFYIKFFKERKKDFLINKVFSN